MDGQIRLANGGVIHVSEEADRIRGASKAEKQLAEVRMAIDCISNVAGMEENQSDLGAVTSRCLRAMTPLRNLEALLVRTIEGQQLEAHIKSINPTPGMQVR